MGPDRKIILSFKSREYISKARSPLGVCSTTIGTKPEFIFSIIYLFASSENFITFTLDLRAESNFSMSRFSKITILY